MEELVSAREMDEVNNSMVSKRPRNSSERSDDADAPSPVVTPPVAAAANDDNLRSVGESFLYKLNETMKKVRGEPPLHLAKLIGGNFKEIMLRVGSNFQVGNRAWMRPDLCVISYQHLPEANRKAVTGAASRMFAPQRLIVVLPLLHTIMKPKVVDDDLLEHEPSLMDPTLPETLRMLSDRGYKLVLVEHFPMLHHGNAYALQMIAQRTIALLEKHFNSLPIQVVFSVGSYYASALPGVSRCLLPNAGVYQVFMYHYNGQIEADPERSFFVKTAEERIGGFGFSSLNFQEQEGFASCCGRKGLKTVDFQDLRKHAEALSA
jgi:hypothetical protein